jgi:hypothetical protein
MLSLFSKMATPSPSTNSCSWQQRVQKQSKLHHPTCYRIIRKDGGKFGDMLCWSCKHDP